MDTKSKIKQAAISLLNEQGIRNITLRDIAAALKISYGNVTYHFQGKDDLLIAIYKDMLSELRSISDSFSNIDNPLQLMLEAPALTYELSIKYMFLYKDYGEIRRSFPLLSELLEKENKNSKSSMLHILKHLQNQGVLKNDLGKKDLELLMELSGMMRTMYFIENSIDESNKEAHKIKYLEKVNGILKPYLRKEHRKLV